MRIHKENTIALVIDIQERLLPHIKQHEEMLVNTGILIDGLQVLDVPMLITEQYRKGLGPSVKEIQEKFDDFTPLEKTTFSCCDDDGINRELKDYGRKNVIICGIEAHVCILQTAIDLISEGYQPVLIADCVSSKKLEDKLVALERMRQEGARSSSYESILFELARVSGTEKFKAISRLVK